MKPLLDIRWVCAICLHVIRVPLQIRMVKHRLYDKCINEITSVRGPLCCGQSMLIAGEPKVDRWGSGAMIDPVDNLRLKARAA